MCFGLNNDGIGALIFLWQATPAEVPALNSFIHKMDVHGVGRGSVINKIRAQEIPAYLGIPLR
ncbi:hypothetical protein CBM2595_A80088 [Cupriavidus taiwanensis]|nr:hypothetical protein CBM2595_A80088 [Cupriavidus taiwanensis]